MARPEFYYRDFPSNLLPARTPFTRSGRGDAGQLFIYVSNRLLRWSLLLAKERVERIYPEARQQIPPGFAHVWLLEKRYSTRRAGTPGRAPVPATVQDHRTPVTGLGGSFIVLAEPSPAPGAQGDVLSYHLQEDAAIAAADGYTRRHRRRAIVGLLVWDDYWF